MISPHPDDVERYNSAYRQVMRRRSRGIVGATTSTLLTPTLPHMGAAAAVGFYAVDRADKAREKLRELEQQRGFKPRKRDWLAATLQGVAEKAILTTVTLGHDELFLSIYGGLVNYDVDEIVSAHDSVVDTEILSDINSVVNAPVNAAQDAFDVQGEETRIKNIGMIGTDTGGWHEAPETVAKSIVGVGAVAGAVEYAVDRPFGYRDEKAEAQRKLEEAEDEEEKAPRK